MFVSKLRSWIRALGAWRDGMETQKGTERQRGKYKAI